MFSVGQFVHLLGTEWLKTQLHLFIYRENKQVKHVKPSWNDIISDICSIPLDLQRTSPLSSHTRVSFLLIDPKEHESHHRQPPHKVTVHLSFTRKTTRVRKVRLRWWRLSVKTPPFTPRCFFLNVLAEWRDTPKEPATEEMSAVCSHTRKERKVQNREMFRWRKQWKREKEMLKWALTGSN